MGATVAAARQACPLTRRLGPVDGAAVIISNVVGIGIFTTPGLVAELVSGRGSVIGLWVIGGVLALIGGLVYAELGGAFPEAGGEYVYLREAFGPGVAFLSGWTSLIAGFAGAIAAGAVGFALYLERVIPGLPQHGVALALIAALALIHARGLGPGRAVQNALAALSVLAVAGLVALGLVAPAIANVAVPAAAPREGGLLVALVLVMFTYSGWNAAAYLAGELRAPGRTLRAAVLAGTAVVIMLYLGLNLVYLRTVSPGELEGSTTVADLAARAVVGPAGAGAMAVVVGLALASGVGAMLLAGPRIYFAMARDGILPAVFGRVHPRSGVPSFAIGVQALWSGVLVLSGAFESLITYTAFAIVLFSGLAVGALFALRRRPDWERRATVRAWGHPWTSGLFLLAAGAMLVQAIRYAPEPSLAGAALIAAGIPIYLITRSSAVRSRSAALREPPVEGDKA